MTQQELAQAIGVNASYIGPLEKGIKCPSVAVLEKLSGILGQPVFSFFLEETAEESTDSCALRVSAILASHTPDERRFLVNMAEEMSVLLRKRR